jgi:hypothetical protein
MELRLLLGEGGGVGEGGVEGLYIRLAEVPVTSTLPPSHTSFLLTIKLASEGVIVKDPLESPHSPLFTKWASCPVISIEDDSK